jgi:prepilin-type N-terminal cleavage/methylation domain-containing protein
MNPRNIEHRTPNIERPISGQRSNYGPFNVQRSMFNVRCFPLAQGHVRRAFTLIEIMIVVAIMGMIAAMGLPSILKVMQREGMRKGMKDFTDACFDARAKAIVDGQKVVLIIHPLQNDRSFYVEGGGAKGMRLSQEDNFRLPDGVEFSAVGNNSQDCTLWDTVPVGFYPNGTCDEMTVVIDDRKDYRKISLEFSTGLPRISDVDK